MATTLPDPFPTAPDRLPSALALQIFSDCNLRCHMCAYAHCRPGRNRSMDPELFRSVVLELHAAGGLRGVGLSLQCEPLLDPLLFARLAWLKGLSPKVHAYLSSNAVLLTPDVLARLCESGLEALNLSLNALSAETYAQLTGRSDFGVLLANVRHVIEHKPPGLAVTLSAVLTRATANEFLSRRQPLLELAQAAGIGLAVGPISNHCGALPDYDSQVVLAGLQSSVHKRYCHDPFTAVYVLWDGTVIGCCSDWRRRFVLGNATECGLVEIWNSLRARSRRQQLLHGEFGTLEPCRECSQAWNIRRNRERLSAQPPVR